jgi:exonuclease SbcC
MKFHTIEIENIASLRGHHKINFDNALGDNNLFAITGDTGAGKSSILNAISLALYGKNYKSTITQTDFITLGAHFGKISLDFSIGNKHFLTKWEAKVLKKDGSPIKSPKTIRTYYNITKDENIPLSGIDFENALGLNYNQFCKTVILNQGEFNKFLTSSFAERKEILEKLYNNSQISNLKYVLKNKLKTLTTLIDTKKGFIDLDLDELKVEKKTLDLMIKENKVDIDKNTSITKIFELIKDSFKLIENAIKNVNSFEDKTIKCKFKIKEGKSTIEIIKTELNNANDYYTVFEKEFKIENIKINEQIKLFEQIQSTNIYIDKISSKLKESIKSKDVYIEKLESVEKQLTEIKNSSTDIASSYNLSNPAQEMFSSDFNKVEDYFSIKALIKDNTKLKIDITESHLKLNQKIEDLLKRKEKSVKHIENVKNNLIKSQKIKNIDIEEKQSLLQTLATKITFIADSTDELSELNLEFGAEKDSQTALLQKSKKLKLEIEIIEKENELNKLNNAITLCVKHSNKADHCLVCNSEIVEKIEVQNTETSNKDNQKIMEKFNDLENDIKNQKYRITLKEKNIVKIKNQIVEILLEFDSPDVQKLETKKKKLESEINNYQDSLQKIALLNKDHENETKNLSYTETTIKETQTNLSNYSDKLNSINGSLSGLHERISPLSKSILIDMKSHSLETLRDLNATIKENLINNKTCLKEKLHFEKNLTDITKSVETENSELNENTKLLKSFQSKLTYKNPIEKQDQLNLKKDSLVKAKEGLTKKHHYQLSLINEDENNLKNAEAIIKDNQSIINIHIKEISHTIRISKNVSEISFFKKLTSLDEFQSSLSFSIESFTALFSEFDKSFILIKEHSKVFKEKEVELKTNFNSITINIKKIELINTELEVHNKTFKDLKILDDVIGKDEFRNFILTQIEKKLIKLTNKELKTLCGARYSIRLSLSGNKPEYFIIDKLNQGLERKINTLSGGETFMVSLTMALALGELTRGNAQIDSFFIDEGFGTLDSESIEDVFETLINIQTTGKQIGIISHITDLTDRFENKIKLTKNKNGSSSISMTNN